MHQPPPADQSTFESRAQYNLQATADDDDEDEHYELEKIPPPIPERPNYRPKPLQWPFIVCVIVILTVMMALVVYACETMPNSDSTATILPRHVIQPRQQPSSGSSVAEPSPSSKPEPKAFNSQVSVVSSGNGELSTTSEQKQPPSSSLTQAQPASKANTQQAASSPDSVVIPNKSTSAIILSSSPAEKTGTPIATVISERTSGASSSRPSITSKVDEKTSYTSTGVTSQASIPIPSSEGSEKPSSSVINGSDASTQSLITASESEDVRQMKGSSASISTVSGARSAVVSPPGLTDQRKAPGTGTTTLSTTSTLSSTSMSTTRKPTSSDEVMLISKSTFTSTLTSNGSTVTYSTNYTSFVSSTFTTLIPTTFSDGTGTYPATPSAITRTTTRTEVGTSFMTTMSLPMTTTRVIPISDGPAGSSLTTTQMTTRMVTSAVVVTPGTVIEVTTEFPEQTPGGDEDVPLSTGFYTSVVVTAIPTTIATIATSTGPAVVYVSVGTTEITIVSTISRDSGEQQNANPTPVTHVITSVFDQKIVTVVETGAPQRLVVTDGGVFTAVFTPPPVTVVTRNGGQEAEMVITVTPSLDVALVAVPTIISGKTTLLAVESTIGAFRPVSLTLVSQVGGSTSVFTTTDPPETVRTVIDGKETTIVRTPAPREYTSVVGGTPTTVEVITTPTGTMPMLFTVITTIGGSVSTIVSTPVPITLVTSISGKLSTITSTPRPTTRLSTIMASTVTFTSVSSPTITGSAENIITKVERVGFTGGDYFVGKFLPVILAVTITIPLRIIDLNAKLYQPFFAMAQEGGALGKNSLTLQFDGWEGFLTPFKVLMQGHPVPFITTLMLWSSALLVPLATEAIGMKLHGTCKITAIEGCGIRLGVSTLSAHALVAMIVFIIALLLVLLYLLRNWETGLHANPWSIAGVSSLARNASIRSQIIDFKASEKAMTEKRYMLGYFENGQGKDEYGIIYYDDSSQNLQAAGSGALPNDDELDGINQRNVGNKLHKPVPFIALTYWWRLGFIFFLASLFILVVYYHVTLQVRSSFQEATDSQSWGVRFFLSALGVIIVFCWESIFVSIAIISPYYHMERQSQQPESSILLTRPTNSFYGIYAAILEGNVVLMLAAFMAILAEFLPILLTNIPYNLTQTLATHNMCAVASISILALMLATLVASLFTKWPDMPVDPRSIAGAMYYINESRMLEDFEGLSKLSSDDREKKVKELGRRYFYGAISGKDGRRMAVDSIESVECTAYTGGTKRRFITSMMTRNVHLNMNWGAMRRITTLGMNGRKG
ncbi:uncharacterized protein GLRG_09091 [Colletotrichum graminicola M1.001]|uniref:Zonadhesin n=1 Tax=Colletotrichum graminicola (strain M1.001 / M2 / FGSC 10212) TaxID=645133 RepID=E3QSV9_COLGM|nr:uncharacterized protein GLRG_09091 [Colletotrichum graminicola M1.001]EFQ33947.1 hypothetical protein GLRG_09091 [Colletotrichum graminicola M1.001]